MTPLEELVGRVIQREGGVADVGDGKGVTRWGQTEAWLEQFNLPVPQSAEDAAANYLKWLDVVGLTTVVSPGDDLADILLDIAVMSSAAKAVKALQAVLGVKVDGILGPKTRTALAWRDDRKKLARELIAWDIAYQGRLITLDPTRAQYSAGWAARMAEHVRRLA